MRVTTSPSIPAALAGTDSYEALRYSNIYQVH